MEKLFQILKEMNENQRKTFYKMCQQLYRVSSNKELYLEFFDLYDDYFGDYSYLESETFVKVG